MDRFLNVRRGPGETEPEPRRISTPAGDRLSTILENGVAQPPKSHRPRRLSLSIFAEDPKGSQEASLKGYSNSDPSEKSPMPSPSLRKGFRNKKQLTKRGGWKRLAAFGLLSLLVLVAVIAGLVVGLKKRKSGHGSSQAVGAGASGSSAPDPSQSPSNSSMPKSFPIGSWSMVTFLDTVSTNCTANPATWTCFPYTVYNDDHTKSEATFNWVITAGSKSGTYQISSTDNPFAIKFQNTLLTLVDAGTDSERYTFQVTMDKEVQPSGPITSDNSAAICYFNGTTFQGYLYTKRPAQYSPPGQSPPNGSYPAWPFAVRAEQVIGGGQQTPNCYKTANGNMGPAITTGLAPQDPSDLCDCLYRNYM